MVWHGVSLTIAARHVDALTELLERLGALSVTFAPTVGADSVLEPAPGETPM